jgi:hypothetical protein
MSKSLLTKSLIVSALAAVHAASFAAVTTYTDRAAWEAATSGVTNVDFEGLAPSSGFTDYGSTGLTVGDATFTGSDNYLFVVDAGFSPGFYDWGSGAVLLGNQFGTITVNLAGGKTAIGSDIMSILNYASPFSITLSNGDVFAASTNNHPDRAFFGITSDVAITSITFSATDGYPELDNFAYGSGDVVPEPATLTLFGGALAALAARRRRKA